MLNQQNSFKKYLTDAYSNRWAVGTDGPERMWNFSGKNKEEVDKYTNTLLDIPHLLTYSLKLSMIVYLVSNAAFYTALQYSGVFTSFWAGEIAWG